MGSVARTIISSSESVIEGTSVFASREEAHTALQDEAFALPLDLPAGNSGPLLAVHKVGMNPNDFSPRCGNKYKAFLLLLVRVYVDHS